MCKQDKGYISAIAIRWALCVERRVGFDVIAKTVYHHQRVNEILNVV